MKLKKFCCGILLGLSTLLLAGQVSANTSGVQKITDLANDFITGADLSSAQALNKAGVAYYDLNHKKADLLTVMKQAGVNYVRLRIWNNPYQSQAPYLGYGGGNTDLNNAEILGRKASQLGMKVLIDLQYADFWCDPAKQYPPKAWKNYTLEQKKTAVYGYTKWTLQELLKAGVNVGMVQIGNETNGSMCGVGGLYGGKYDLSDGVAALIQAGCYAVDDVNRQNKQKILKAVHFTDLNTNGYWYAQCLAKQKVDYDVFATSYYPMWHGTTAQLTASLSKIAKTFHKKVMVAETAAPYTLKSFDETPNTVSQANIVNKQYAVSVSGQAQALRDVFFAVNRVNQTVKGAGLGAFYWEPGWICSPKNTWKTSGSGWASQASASYEKDILGYSKYFSQVDCGSSWENMALFDNSGQALKSLAVFKDIR